MNMIQKNENRLQTQFAPVQNQLPAHTNVGAVAIEQERAIAEAQGQLAIAKRFPRDVNASYAELMSSCAIPSLAAVAFYNVPRAGGMISGPSIRLAEEIARCYGNFEYGHRELSRDDEKSEVEVYAWDKEKNNFSRRQITVMHYRDTKQGPVKLRDENDILAKIANVASKQIRSRILALVPKWMVEDAIQACRSSLAGSAKEPMEVRIRRMVSAFASFGVTTEMLEEHLEHSLSKVTVDEIVDLMGVYNSIKDGHMKASEIFATIVKEEPEQKDVVAAAGKARNASSGFKAPEKKQPAQKQAAKQEPVTEPDPILESALRDAHDAEMMQQLDQTDDGFDPDNY